MHVMLGNSTHLLYTAYSSTDNSKRNQTFRFIEADQVSGYHWRLVWFVDSTMIVHDAASFDREYEVVAVLVREVVFV